MEVLSAALVLDWQCFIPILDKPYMDILDLVMPVYLHKNDLSVNKSHWVVLTFECYLFQVKGEGWDFLVGETVVRLLNAV